MRILLFTEQFPPLIGGAAHYLYNLLKRFRPKDIVVYTARREGSLGFDRSQKMKIIRGWIWGRPFWPPRIESILGPFYLLVSLVRTVVREKISVIYCGTVYPFAAYGLFFKVFFGIDYVVFTFAEEITILKKNKFKKIVISFLFRHAQSVVSISDFAKRELMELKVPEERINVIPAGVDPVQFSPQDVSGLKKELGLQGKKVILTLARLGERKNQETVIRALPKVLSRVSDAVYVIVGSGPTEERLKTLVKRLDLDEQVIFISGVDHCLTPQYYNLCEVYILPCRQIESTGDLEGFPLVFLEANSCAKPVIGGRAGGSQEAIVNGKTGFLLDDSLDHDEVAETILRLLFDQDLSLRMGQAGVARVKEFFTWDILAGRLKQVLGYQ
ncbi:glycosyltransferase family 4 protein [Candidatus Omnitrophota bacterium]